MFAIMTSYGHNMSVFCLQVTSGQNKSISDASIIICCVTDLPAFARQMDLWVWFHPSQLTDIVLERIGG